MRARAHCAALGLTALLAVQASAAVARPPTTQVQTIADRDGDNRLEPARGEDHVVRDDLGEALPGRERRRVDRLFFAQMGDIHVIDEESPARVEFLDAFGPPFTSAYRPQEALQPQVVNEMVDQLRNTVSPVTRSRLELVMTTADNTDNSQLNETRWLIDLLDGGVEVDPNSGIPGTCGVPPDHLYDGVRGDNRYYEPDRSPTPGADNVDGPGYSPDQEENEREAQRSSSVRDFPGLFEAANRPFRSVGLGVPWYGIFGNHDMLIQGNQPRNAAFEQIATGCVKVTSLSPGALAEIQGALAGEGSPADKAAQVRQIAFREMQAALGDPTGFGGAAALVPQDPRRRPLLKSEYMQEHFTTRGSPPGHGFGFRPPEAIVANQGYYAFDAKPGLRFIVLDSVNEGGQDGGNIDDTQFRWLHRELRDAESSGRLAMVFAHHPLRGMNQLPASPFAPGDQQGDRSPLVHFGNGPGTATTPCTITDPAAEPTLDETLRCLLLRHRSAIALVDAHEHENRVTPNARRDAAGRLDGGFWEISTAAHIDWPQQSRVIDLVDNRDGNLSIFGTIVDHAAPPNPGGAPPGDGRGAASGSVRRHASISRELSYNDPQANNGEDGRPDARGSRADRNVELVVRNPYGG